MRTRSKPSWVFSFLLDHSSGFKLSNRLWSLAAGMCLHSSTDVGLAHSAPVHPKGVWCGWSWGSVKPVNLITSNWENYIFVELPFFTGAPDQYSRQCPHSFSRIVYPLQLLCQSTLYLLFPQTKQQQPADSISWSWHFLKGGRFLHCWVNESDAPRTSHQGICCVRCTADREADRKQLLGFYCFKENDAGFLLTIALSGGLIQDYTQMIERNTPMMSHRSPGKTIYVQMRRMWKRLHVCFCFHRIEICSQDNKTLHNCKNAQNKVDFLNFVKADVSVKEHTPHNNQQI